MLTRSKISGSLLLECTLNRDVYPFLILAASSSLNKRMSEKLNKRMSEKPVYAGPESSLNDPRVESVERPSSPEAVHVLPDHSMLCVGRQRNQFP